MATSLLRPFPKTVAWIPSSVLHLGSQRAFRAVLRARTRMEGRDQTAPDAPNYRAGGTRGTRSLLPSAHECFFKQSNLGVRVFNNFSDPWEEHFGPVCLGDTCWRTETVLAKPQHPSCPGCTDKPLSPPSPSPSHPLEPSLSDLWCTETSFTLQKALIRPWKAIKGELHMSVKGFSPRADVLLADAPPTSLSSKLCSTSGTRPGEGQSCSWAARLVFIRPFSGNKKYGETRWSSPAAAGVDYRVGSSRNALRRAPSNGWVLKWKLAQC